MAVTISIYLDSRATKNDSPAPLKAVVRRNGFAAYIPTDIKLLPTQWDQNKCLVKNHPNAQILTRIIIKKKLDIETALYRLMDDGEIAGLNAVQIRDKILHMIDPDLKEEDARAKLFMTRFVRFMDLKTNKDTKLTYDFTLKHLQKFDSRLHQRRFEDINKDYLQNFDKHCADAGLKKNSRNICLRNIRTVFNDAIDAEVTSCYPFRKLPITPDATKKKALTIDQLRQLITYPCSRNQAQYRDMFLLMFMFRGVNAGDLFTATRKDILDGRFDYVRNKVGTLFSVKVEPEAQELIDRYRGKKHLLCPLDSYKSYKDYLHHMNDGLKTIGRPTGKRGKYTSIGPFSELSSNWARHTWATVASGLDIPKEVISKGLGHRFGLAVTDIYIDFDNKKVDDANRKVLDYVLYGKDWREIKRTGAPSTVCLPEQNEMKENIRSSATA